MDGWNTSFLLGNIFPERIVRFRKGCGSVSFRLQFSIQLPIPEGLGVPHLTLRFVILRVTESRWNTLANEIILITLICGLQNRVEVTRCLAPSFTLDVHIIWYIIQIYTYITDIYIYTVYIIDTDHVPVSPYLGFHAIAMVFSMESFHPRLYGTGIWRPFHLDLEIVAEKPKKCHEIPVGTVVYINIWKYIPSRELTYPTFGIGKSSSKCHFWGIC